MAELSQYSDDQLRSLSDSDFDAIVSGNPGDLSDAGRRSLGIKSGALDMLDTATSIGGALAGGVFGPVGMVAGGAAGAALGEFIENKVSGTGDAGDVGKAAAISAAFDVGTLGLGKAFKVGRALFGKPASQVSAELRPLITKSTADVVNQPGQRALATAQSQAMALEGGASLPVSATQSARWYHNLAEQLGSVSFFSKGTAENNAKKLSEAVVASFDDLTRGADNYKSLEEVADFFVANIEAGNKIAQDIYGKGLSEIQGQIAAKEFGSAPIAKAIRGFLKENQSKMFKSTKVKSEILDAGGAPIVTAGKAPASVTTLHPKAYQLANKALGQIDGATFKGDGIIEFQKIIRAGIDDAYSEGKGRLARDLVGLENVIKNGIETSMRKSGAKQIASDYKLLNETYKETQERLFPTLGEKTIRKAMTGDSQKLGKILATTADSPKKLNQIMGSIDESVRLIAKQDGKSVKWAMKEAERIKRNARAGFIWNMTNSLDEGKIMSKNFVDNIMKPENAKKMKAIFGDEWSDMQRAMNFARDAFTPKGGLGALSLALNSMQIQTIQGAAAGAVLLGGASGTFEGTALPAWAEALAILALPSVFYKVATTPASINRLIALDNKVAKKGLQAIKAQEVISAMGKIMGSLSAEDKAQARAEATENRMPVYF